MLFGRQKASGGAVELVPDHLKARYVALLDLPVAEPEAPWRKTIRASVGGLTGIGYAQDSDLLLVTSFAGRAVFDCRTGERLSRDDEYPFKEDVGNCEAEGIGPLSGKMIRVAGVGGGGLAAWSKGWSLEVLPLSWPKEKLLLFPEGKSVWDDRQPLDGVIKLDVDVLRAFGFSPTGRSFAVASSSDLLIYSLAELEK